ncbi:unnamed protein product [Closterium sp. NIES-64]|nr:unnamed protein product [Closterium sp. NIES-64]
MLPTNVPRNSPFVAGSDATAVASCAMAFVADEMSRYCPSSRCCPSFFRSSMCRPIRHLPVSRRQLLAARRHILAARRHLPVASRQLIATRRQLHAARCTLTAFPARPPVDPYAAAAAAHSAPAAPVPPRADSLRFPVASKGVVAERHLQRQLQHHRHRQPRPRQQRTRQQRPRQRQPPAPAARPSILPPSPVAFPSATTTVGAEVVWKGWPPGVEEGKGEGVRFQGAAELGGAVKRGGG